MINETWIVHCLYIPNGRSSICIADSRKNANKIRKEMCSFLCFGDVWSSQSFSCITRKVKNQNTMVIDLT